MVSVQLARSLASLQEEMFPLMSLPPGRFRSEGEPRWSTHNSGFDALALAGGVATHQLPSGDDGLMMASDVV